jgi:ElaB/YqjD/DUF883 family membrane-anchored ribosome-binding protein
MGENKDPEVIAGEIEETRARMGERVDALTYKADVKSRIGDKVAEKREALTGRVRGLVPQVSEQAPSGEDVKRQAGRAAGIVQDNPLGLALGAAAVGLLVGLLLPTTNIEDQKLGEVADKVKAKAAETGQEALSRGQQVAQDVVQSASETVRESGSQHAGELSETAQQKASEAAADARSGLSG